MLGSIVCNSSDETYSWFDCGLFEKSAERALLHALGNRPAQAWKHMDVVVALITIRSHTDHTLEPLSL